MCDFTNLESSAPTAKGEPNLSRRPRNTNGRAVGLAQKYDCSCGTERTVSDICQTHACLDLQRKRLLIQHAVVSAWNPVDCVIRACTRVAQRMSGADEKNKDNKMRGLGATARNLKRSFVLKELFESVMAPGREVPASVRIALGSLLHSNHRALVSTIALVPNFRSLST